MERYSLCLARKAARALFASALSFLLLAVFPSAAVQADPVVADPEEPVPVRGNAAVPHYYEYDKRLRAVEQVAPLGSDLFGDNISLYSGQTSFSQVDIDLPGNNALPVQLRRRYVVSSLLSGQRHDPIGGPGNPYGGLENWDIEVPHIYGIFDDTYRWDIPNATTTQQPRCSTLFVPQTVVADQRDVWSGNKVSIPGEGEKTIYALDPSYGPLQYPNDGRPPTWTTADFDAFSCISSPTAHGEGFVMTTRAGITYTFDVYRTRAYSSVLANNVSNARIAIFLLASKVQDRYGNTVTYQYNVNGHPTSITASDGRAITLTYGTLDETRHRLESAKITLDHPGSTPDETRTWTYTYQVQESDGLPRLTAVTLPDGVSKWTYDYTLRDVEKKNVYLYVTYEPPSDGSGNECLPSHISTPGGDFGLRMTHPSGAKGEFIFKFERSYRDNINSPTYNCVSKPGGGYSYAVAPYIDTFRLKSKTLFHADNGSSEWKYDGHTVIQPDGSELRHTFSSAWGATRGSFVAPPPGTAMEGQLLGVTTVKNGVELRKEVNEYFTGLDVAGAFPGQPFPSRVGIGGGGDDDSVGSVRPLKSVTITQQGVTFKRTYSNFDALGRPRTVGRTSSIGATTLYSKVEDTVYEDNRTTWLLDQIKRVTDIAVPTSSIVLENGFDAAGNIISVSRFGRLDSTMTWNGDGTLATVTNGPNTTVLGPFKRGIPQSVSYGDLSSISAVIDDAGDIRSVTDENGFVTSYGYDSLRRLTSITYPGNDVVAWLPTTFQYERVGTYGGVVGTHWRRTTSTGNARKVVDYDQRLRPVLTREYDTASPGTTDRYVRRGFDYANRETFVSYPTTSVAAGPGVQTTYDALGRVVATQQDSELGALGTSTVYTNPFKTVFTNARGKVTSTTFQVFDEPTESSPVLIESPLGVTTTIARDNFGKPRTMTRSGTFDGSPVSAARQYVYDSSQRLCKTVEPESGATILSYNSANLVAWRASGLNLTSTSSCNQANVASASKVSYAYDARDRLLSTTYGDNSPNVVSTYTPDGLLNTISSDGSLWTLSYNKRRLLTSETLTLDGTQYPFNYTHTAGGHVATMTYPGGSSLAYAPNALGEAAQVGNYATLIRRHPNGALKSFNYGNGIQHTTDQNLRGLPSRSTDAGVLNDRYTYDESANVTAIADDLTGDFTRTMSYDDRDRLITASNSGLWGGTQTFVYDPLDNLRRSATPKDGAWVHHYNATTQRLERIELPAQSRDLFTYGYNARGQVTTRGPPQIQQAFTIDLADRVRQISPGVATYRYDGHGRRTRVTKGGTTAVQIYSQAGQLLYQSSQGIQDGIFKNGFQAGDQSYGSNTVINTRYLYLGRHLLAEDGTGGRRYIHTDGLGSPARTSGTDGIATPREDYRAYGKGGPNQSKPDFTGHVADPETGLIYMQARYYDPFAGRFLAVDPVAASPASFNRYWYANNNPYKYVDPDGRATTCLNGECTMVADTFDPARSSGVTSVAGPTTRDAVEKGASAMRARKHPETGGVVRKDAQGGEAVKRAAGGAESRDGIPMRNIKADSSVRAIVHGHVEGGSGKSDGLVDTPSANGGYGDTQSLSLSNPIPTATIFKDQIGWHELLNGRLQFTYKEGDLSEGQSAQMQKNLDAQQSLFHK